MHLFNYVISRVTDRGYFVNESRDKFAATVYGT